jgi:hypothetical protein
MELQFNDGLELEIDSNCEFEIPEYMTRLPPEEISQDCENKDSIVIAAGTDPTDGKITLLTLSGKIMIFDSRKFYIPDGPSAPVDGGKKIFLENLNGRWPGQSQGFYVETSWILEKSASALIGATLHTNYSYEDDVRRTT